MTKKKFLLISVCIVVVILFLPFLVLLVLTGTDYTEGRVPRKEFDSAVWKNTDQAYDQPYPRLQMVDDLLMNHDLTQMGHDELLSLLGEPEETAYFKEYDLFCWLGPERKALSIDSEWLAIKIGGNSSVEEIKIISD